MRVVVAVLALCLLPAACVRAGGTIFEDRFADSSGGWDFEGARIMTVRPPELVVAPTAKLSGQPMLNLTFTAAAGTYCMDAVLPRSPAADNAAAVAITFWATDYEHRDIFVLYSKGTAILFNRTNGIFYQIYREEHAAAFDAADGVTNTLCVVAKDGTLTLLLNRSVLKVVRAQFPTAPLRFGIEAGVEKPIADAPVIRVKSFKVTAP